MNFRTPHRNPPTHTHLPPTDLALFTSIMENRLSIYGYVKRGGYIECNGGLLVVGVQHHEVRGKSGRVGVRPLEYAWEVAVEDITVM